MLFRSEKADTPLRQAVEMVAAAGGVTVVAHARARTRGRLLAIDDIRDLAGHGLGGLEIDHPDHNPADRAVLRELARELDLIATGSSDYHGADKPVGLGECTTDAEQFERLAEKASGVAVIAS